MLNYKSTLAALLGAAIVLLVTGCAAEAVQNNGEVGTVSAPAATQTTTPTQEQAITQAGATQNASGGSQNTPPAPPTKEIPTPMTAQPGAAGSVPDDLLTLLKADAAQKAGVDVSQVVVISVQAVTWNDGSLGCPKPGVMYTQALVSGYEVILSVGGSQYSYHTGHSGSFVECKPQLTAPKPSKAPKPPVSPGDPTH
jgi:hypothetical protein